MMRQGILHSAAFLFTGIAALGAGSTQPRAGTVVPVSNQPLVKLDNQAPLVLAQRGGGDDRPLRDRGGSDDRQPRGDSDRVIGDGPGRNGAPGGARMERGPGRTMEKGGRAAPRFRDMPPRVDMPRRDRQVERPVTGRWRGYGSRGRRYRKDGRWYFWAPWAGIYLYFDNYDACYRTCFRSCRDRDHSRPYCRSYCEDLCQW